MNIQNSIELFERAKLVIPGGVNSPVRSFQGVGGNPLFMHRAEGAYLYDENGNEYVDLINSWGPMILGHIPTIVEEAVMKAVVDSISFGTPNYREVEIAELITDMVPSVEMIRMVNSGTEATMSAIRLARGFTKKDKIIKFSGCYHGHFDAFLVEAGSGATTLGIPNSPGVTAETAKNTLTAKYNDLENVQQLIGENHNQIAAVIIEPIAGNMGCVLPQPNFLNGLRKLCDENDILLVFDEVMTGFRVARGGAQELYNIVPDLTTFGKIIGGGMPVGAYGGKKEIMNLVAPSGPVYQAGTLSGNPTAMAAGLAMLQYLNENPSIYKQLNNTGEKLAKGLSKIANKKKIPHQINQIGSMLSVFFTKEEVMNLDTAKTSNLEYFKTFFHGMLENGIYLPPSQFESWFISTSIEKQEIKKVLEASEKAFDKIHLL